MLATQQLSYQIVQEELLMLTGHSQQQPQQPNLQQTTATQAQMPAASAPPPTAHGPSKVGVFAKDMNKDQAKAYVDDLYIKCKSKKKHTNTNIQTHYVNHFRYRKDWRSSNNEFPC